MALRPARPTRLLQGRRALQGRPQPLERQHPAGRQAARPAVLQAVRRRAALRLAANRLAALRLAANRLAASPLVATPLARSASLPAATRRVEMRSAAKEESLSAAMAYRWQQAAPAEAVAPAGQVPRARSGQAWPAGRRSPEQPGPGRRPLPAPSSFVQNDDSLDTPFARRAAAPPSHARGGRSPKYVRSPDPTRRVARGFERPLRHAANASPPWAATAHAIDTYPQSHLITELVKQHRAHAPTPTRTAGFA